MNDRHHPAGALLAVVAFLTAIAAQPAVAETVYRCGNAYADVPCPQATVVDARDTRTAAQAAEARGIASREMALAAQMASDRQQAEARPTPTPVRRVGAKATSASTQVPVLAGRHRRRLTQDNGQGDFVAYAPAPKRRSGTAR